MTIRNFRCYKDETSITFDQITAIVGKNDCGKSTILDALDIFLNDINPDKDDASKTGDGKNLTIICEFDDIPLKVILDDTIETTFRDEYLLNRYNHVEIIKTFSGNTQNPKCTYIAAKAVHPINAELVDLLQLKNSELKKRAKELGVNTSVIDQKVNSQLRAAIREHIVPIELKDCEVPLLEENGKNVWISLKVYLPGFVLFKSDRASTDQDPEAQEPLRAVIKEAIKSKESELNAISSFVEEEVKKIAASTLEKIKSMDPNLASELNPQFTPPKWESIFKASITGDENIPINKRGSGVKRLILLNFFRAKAEQQIREKKCSAMIYGIEEPETSQHPTNQRILLRALSELSSTDQVIITTHTPMLARALPDKSLRYINKEKNGSRSVILANPTTNKLFADALGVLPDNNVKLFIAVEGPTDITFLQAVTSSLYKEGISKINLEEMEINGEIIFFPLGGSTLAVWNSRLSKLARPEFHLYDRDNSPPETAKYQEHVDEVNKRERCFATVTGKKEIENYIPTKYIVDMYKGFNINISLPPILNDFDDVPQIVAKAVHEATNTSNPWSSLDEETIKKKESQVKNKINSIAARRITSSDLAIIDVYGNVISWIIQMEKMIEEFRI